MWPLPTPGAVRVSLSRREPTQGRLLLSSNAGHERNSVFDRPPDRLPAEFDRRLLEPRCLHAGSTGSNQESGAVTMSNKNRSELEPTSVEHGFCHTAAIQ